jgi:hypothetical protein
VYTAEADVAISLTRFKATVTFGAGIVVITPTVNTVPGGESVMIIIQADKQIDP